MIVFQRKVDADGVAGANPAELIAAMQMLPGITRDPNDRLTPIVARVRG